MCYLVIGSDIALFLMVQSQLPDMVAEKNKYNYASFDVMSTLHIFYSYCFAILIAFAFFRLFKYLTIIQSMYQLQATISRVGFVPIDYKILLVFCPDSLYIVAAEFKMLAKVRSSMTSFSSVWCIYFTGGQKSAVLLCDFPLHLYAVCSYRRFLVWNQGKISEKNFFFRHIFEASIKEF